jgi:DNA processing protein
LLSGGGLAVVGSRNVDDALVEFTERVGGLTAAAGRMIISGGARGIDQAAMRSAAAAGGTVVGVLANHLDRAVLDRDNRNLIRDRRLALISPYDPSAGFNVGHAMQRNKLIYALADAGLVVSSDLQKGGTWAGAVEQLEKLRLIQIFVRVNGSSQPGLDALRTKGAAPWPDPQTPEELGRLIADAGSRDRPRRPAQEQLFVGDGAAAAYGEAPAVEQVSDRDRRSVEPATEGMENEVPSDVKAFLTGMATARSLKEVAAELQVSQRQASDWLRLLIAEGVVEKQRRPARYRSAAGNRSLFD